MMTEAILIGLACLLSYFIGVYKATLGIKNEQTDGQADSILRANAARDKVVSGDKSAIESDIYNRDNKQ